MRQFVWKHLSPGLIVLSAVSILVSITTGCAGLKHTNIYANDPFYPEYYAAKNLDSDDIIRLRGYAASLDAKTSDAASLIIGRHYLKYGNKTYGEFLINKFYDSSALSEQMRLFGKLWKVESLVVSKKPKDAEAELVAIAKMPRDEVFFKTMDIYCSRSGVKVVDKNFDDCFDAIINSKKEEFAIIGKNENGIGIEDNKSYFDNMTYEAYVASQIDNVTEARPTLDKNSVINIVDGNAMSEFVQGMIYAISKFGSSYQINSISGDDLAAQKYAVNIKTESKEIDIGGAGVHLDINWEELAYITSNLKLIENYDRVIIAAPNDKMWLAKNVEKNIKARGKYAKTINYSNSSFQSILKEETTRADSGTLLMIGIGNETEILSFVPIAKYLQKSVENQKILLVTNSIDDVNKDREYGKYFSDVHVLAPIRAVNNPTIQKIAEDYFRFFGVKMVADNMIGYDAIVYINSLIDNELQPKYITNISGFINYKAHRPVGLYKFGKQLQFSEEMPELIVSDGSDEEFFEKPIGGPGVQ